MHRTIDAIVAARRLTYICALLLVSILSCCRENIVVDADTFTGQHRRLVHRPFGVRKNGRNLALHNAHPLVAFAAGGLGSKSSSLTKKGAKNKKKNKGNKRGSFLASDAPVKEAAAAPKEARDKSKAPRLDRFGLPIPTEEDIFPPLPPDTELVPVPLNYETNLDDVQDAMTNFIELNYDIFDDNGVEKDAAAGGAKTRDPWKVRLLHKSPPVLAIDNFFTAEECEEYIQIASQDTDDAHSNDENNSSGGALKVNSATFALSLATRTSTTWFCRYSQVPTLLAKVKHLFAKLPLQHMEEPQLVRYRTGEQFSYHYDEVPPPQLDNGGQRLATLLVYLRTLEEGRGGATEFRDLKDASGKTLSVRPVQGSALLFFPASKDGTPDERTLHKGEVAVDEKMIGQIWIHEREYKPVVPEGNTHEEAVEVVREKEVELGYA